MARCLAALAEEKDETSQADLIVHTLQQVERIQHASPEIEQIINLFVSIHFGDELEQPFQKNLAQMTLKFLARNDLRQSVSTPPCRMRFQFFVRGSTRSSNSIERENYCIL